MDRIGEEELADHFWRARYQIGKSHLEWLQDPVLELRVTLKRHDIGNTRLSSSLEQLRAWTS